jgi:hypothetical protein
MSLTETNARIFVAATGAGAGIQSALWATPGASSYLEGCIFPYSQEATARFLGFTPPKFVSREMAVDLAIAAYREVAHCGDDKKPIGLGLTASVSSLRAHGDIPESRHLDGRCPLQGPGRSPRRWAAG